MELPNVPLTATEVYYERLAQNIRQRIKATDNKRARERLEAMLKEAEKRREELKVQQQFEEAAASEESDEILLTDVVEESPVPPSQESDELLLTQIVMEGGEARAQETVAAEESEELLLTEVIEQDDQAPEHDYAAELEADVLLLTDIVEEVSEERADESLTDRERAVMRNRLEGILTRYQDRRHAAPERSAGLLLTDIMQEISAEAPLEKTDLSTVEQAKVKNRLKALLDVFQEEARELPETFGKKQLKGEEIEQILDDLHATKTLQHRTEGVIRDIQAKRQVVRPVSADPVFADACEKVSSGEPLGLLDEFALSPREQQLLEAFSGHLSSYKGLKKQQAFEMQHLTARSIRELDLIFRTYHIDGYLKAELHNIYTRLLNLRSRFSILLH